jgi:hypothetical protein
MHRSLVHATSIAAVLATAMVASPPATAGNVAWSVAVAGPGFGVRVGEPAYWGPRPIHSYRGAPRLGYLPLLAAAYPAPVVLPIPAPYGIVYAAPGAYSTVPPTRAWVPYRAVFVAPPLLPPYRHPHHRY